MNLKHNEVFTCKRYRLYTYVCALTDATKACKISEAAQ